MMRRSHNTKEPIRIRDIHVNVTVSYSHENLIYSLCMIGREGGWALTDDLNVEFLNHWQKLPPTPKQLAGFHRQTLVIEVNLLITNIKFSRYNKWAPYNEQDSLTDK